MAVIERERMVRSVLNGPSVLFLSQPLRAESTVLVLWMTHRKWKESKQQPSMLPGPAVPGCCLVSFHILWAILSTSTIGKEKPLNRSATTTVRLKREVETKFCDHAGPLRDVGLAHRARRLRHHRRPRRRRELSGAAGGALRPADEEHHKYSHSGRQNHEVHVSL